MIRTRFAPSPTGFLHIGGLRTALYAYAFAKSQKGNFILRIEDTDRRRFIPGSIEKIYQALKSFGLNWDEGPFVQSERVATGVYREYAEKLLSTGHAYYCFCPPQSKEEIEEDHEQKAIKLRDVCRELTTEEVKQKIAKGEKPAIRLKIPEREKISFFDFVLKKEISWDSRDVDDVMLLKSDGFPTYHLAAPIDDALMKVTHIIRGRDWLPSTPVHILLFKYLNFTLPEIGHLTDILDPDGGKLSKRKGSVSVEELIAEGYLPEALLNFIMLLGWAPKDNREIFSLADFVTHFQEGNLQTSNPVFNRKKLDWFNGYYLRQKTDEELLSLLKPFVPAGADESLLKKIIPLIKERIVKLGEFGPFAGFFFARPKVALDLFQNLPYKEYLSQANSALAEIDDWSLEKIQLKLGDLREKNNWPTGDFYMALRIALAGSRFTPPITESAEILGKEETLARTEVYSS